MNGLNTAQLTAFVSTNKLNVAQASLALRAAGVSREQRIQILRNAGLITSNGALTVSIKSVTVALWELVKAWAMTPFGMATIVAAAIFAIVKLVDAFTMSLEESREALANLKDEYKNNESELATLNDELQITVDRINELQGMDSLTFTEAEELSNLRKQNIELERKISLLETLQKQLTKDINKSFVDTMSKDLEDGYEYTVGDKNTSGNYNPTSKQTNYTGYGALWMMLAGAFGWGELDYTNTMNEKDYINSVIMRREEIVEALSGDISAEERKSLEQSLSEIDSYLAAKAKELLGATDGITYINNPTTDDEKKVNEWLDFVNDFNDRVMIALGTDGAKTNAFNRLIYNGFSDATSELKDLGEQGQVTAEHLKDPKYNDFINKCIDLGIISDNTEGSLSILASGFNELSSSSHDATNEINNTTSATSSFVKVISKINSLNSGLSELDKIYADIINKGDFDWGLILDNEAFTNAFGGLGEVYNEFIETVANSPDDINACQRAFNNLAHAYIRNSGALNGVTDETRDATVAMLEQMGIANAAILVDEQLALAKEKTRVETEAGANANAQQILDLYNEETATRFTAQAIFELALAKMQANESELLFSSDIERLEELAEAAGATAQSLLNISKAKSFISQAESLEKQKEALIAQGADKRGISAVSTQAQNFRRWADELLSKPITYDVDFSYTGGSTTNTANNSKSKSWFDIQLAEHQHLVAMEQETDAEYLAWLSEAYPKAYNEGIIELDSFYKYQQEVFKGLRDLFKDGLSDVEHEISMRENYDGEEATIIKLYEGLIADVEKEIADARARGLTDEDDYIQELQKKWQDYTKSIEDIQKETTESAKDALDELVDYRIDMLKQDIENEKDALDKKLDNLKEFYDKQKEMLQEQRDEEKYLDEQSEKRKTITDLQAELAMLENDDSAWAQKRKLEIQEEISSAQEELDEFEKDHALDLALDALDDAYNNQEAQIKAEMDALEEKLNDPNALFNQALDDIRNNSKNQLYYQMLMYNRQYGDGKDETVKELWESAYGALEDYEKLFGESYEGVKLGNETGVTDDGGWDDASISGTNPDNQQTSSEQPRDTSDNESEKSYPYGKASDTAGNIRFGAKGDAVRAIQYALNSLGFGNSGTTGCDGDFGAGTQRAVMAFQSAMGISADGIVGSDTRSMFRKQGYAIGTSYATPGIHAVDELGTEYVFESPSDGTRYRMFHGGEKVLTAEATDFLYNFATTGGSFLTKMLSDLFRLSGLGVSNRPAQAIEIHSGDIIVQGNATERTVSEIRRAQRDNLEFMLKEFNRLNK